MRFFLNALLFFGVLFVLLALLYAGVRTLVPDQFIIPTWSMATTLVPGDRVVVNKLLIGARIYTDFDFQKGGQELKSMRMMDADTWDKMSWKAKYDGNMQTAPSPYRDITLWLKEPQVVTHVRFSPKNADNGIHAGDEYELRYWDDGWKTCGTAKAKYEYIEFTDVPRGKLYWLVNLTQGKEEMPFVIDEQGRQRFVYYDRKEEDF